ncbi:MAG: bifunctional DNA-formamidopyrimidine glycosylase/DNA-(apurinic or apyrimidinic site) lyase [Polyangiaceae bacterium]|nr:bifunctional DNA-formamidopyrimidine glycosylase/DNA-(apurinic or apyrimidinic site) lyase [Polyangiaceae bacterium]
MPELPDVEIARRHLQRWLVGGKVSGAHCTDKRLTRPKPPRAFARALNGRTVDSLTRKGKWLRFVLDDGSRVFSHLGMTGDWVHAAMDAPAQRSERARIDVVKRGRATSVRYVDARRFGRLVVSRDDIEDWTVLGPDPLADGIDVRRLAGKLADSRRAVKAILMDQEVLAGVGNILATEALWMARIDPRSPGVALLPADTRAIAKGLRRSIERELRDTRTAFFVYGRAGEPCPRCDGRLASVVVGDRTSVYCGSCQVRRKRTR